MEVLAPPSCCTFATGRECECVCRQRTAGLACSAAQMCAPQALLIVIYESAYPHTAVLGNLPGTRVYRCP